VRDAAGRRSVPGEPPETFEIAKSTAPPVSRCMTETRAVLFADSIIDVRPRPRPSIILEGPKVITSPKGWARPSLRTQPTRRICPEDFLQARF